MEWEIQKNIKRKRNICRIRATMMRVYYEIPSALYRIAQCLQILPDHFVCVVSLLSPSWCEKLDWYLWLTWVKFYTQTCSEILPPRDAARCAIKHGICKTFCISLIELWNIVNIYFCNFWSVEQIIFCSTLSHVSQIKTKYGHHVSTQDLNNFLKDMVHTLSVAKFPQIHEFPFLLFLTVSIFCVIVFVLSYNFIRPTTLWGIFSLQKFMFGFMLWHRETMRWPASRTMFLKYIFITKFGLREGI